MFEQLTRVFKNDATGEVKSQPILVDLNAVTMLRPSNRLGKVNGHRTTITVDGRDIDVSEKFSRIRNLLDDADLLLD